MGNRLDPLALPPPLSSLSSELVEKWSISDDVERDIVMRAASDDELQHLVAAFTPEMFTAFNAFLDTNPPESEWLLWVGLAAAEAASDLDRRAKGG